MKNLKRETPAPEQSSVRGKERERESKSFFFKIPPLLKGASPARMGGVKGILKITLTSLIAAFACTGIIYAATTVGTNISTGGTITSTGANTFYGVTSIGGALTATSTLDVTGLTTLGNASTTLLSVSGNLTIGNGTPDVTQTGGSGYFTTTLEVDGAARFDGEATFNSATDKVGVGTATPADEYTTGKLKVIETITDQGHGWKPMTGTDVSGMSGTVEIRATINTTINQYNDQPVPQSAYNQRGRLLGIFPEYHVESDVLSARSIDGINLFYYRDQPDDFGQTGVIYPFIIGFGHNADTIPRSFGALPITGKMNGMAMVPFRGGGTSHHAWTFEVDRQHGSGSITENGYCSTALDSPDGYNGDCFYPIGHGSEGAHDATYSNSYDCEAGGSEWIQFHTRIRCEANNVCTDLRGDADETTCETTYSGLWADKTSAPSTGTWNWRPFMNFMMRDEPAQNWVAGRAFRWGDYENSFNWDINPSTFFSIKPHTQQLKGDEIPAEGKDDNAIYATPVTVSDYTITVSTTAVDGDTMYVYCQATGGGTIYIDSFTMNGGTPTTAEIAQDIATELNALTCFSGCSAVGSTVDPDACNGTYTIRAIAVDHFADGTTGSDISLPAYPYAIYGGGTDASGADFISNANLRANIQGLRLPKFTNISQGDWLGDDAYGTQKVVPVLDTDDGTSGVISDNLLFITEPVNPVLYATPTIGTFGTPSTYTTWWYYDSQTLFKIENGNGISLFSVTNSGNVNFSSQGGSVRIGSHSGNLSTNDGELFVEGDIYIDDTTVSTTDLCLRYTQGESTALAKLCYDRTNSPYGFYLSSGNEGKLSLDENGNLGLSYSTLPKIDTTARRVFTMRDGVAPTTWGGAGNNSRAALWVQDNVDGDGNSKANTATYHMTNEEHINAENMVVMNMVIKTTTGLPTVTDYNFGTVVINTIDGTIHMYTQDTDSEQWVRIDDGTWTP